MKITTITMLCGISFFVSACGFPGGGMKLKYQGTETSIEPKSAFVAPNSSGGHSIQITNYPVEMGNTYEYSKIRAKENGQYRLDIMIVKKKADSVQPVEIGEYKILDPKQELKDKLVRATIYRFENGADSQDQLDYNDIKGSLKITVVEGETVKGTIDLDDGKLAIKGDFTARALSY
jgi:hypothetical protein